jgi:hypothetical protein
VAITAHQAIAKPQSGLKRSNGFRITIRRRQRRVKPMKCRRDPTYFRCSKRVGQGKLRRSGGKSCGVGQPNVVDARDRRL